VRVIERLLDAVGAEAADRAAHEQTRFVDRITERVTGIAEHNQIARLPHESGQVTYRTFDYDIDALHRNAASRRGVAIDDEKNAMPGCAPG
jgi:hypothetical protein